MPTIPPILLNCVVYLYPNKARAEENRTPGGTGFLVGLLSKMHAKHDVFHIYAITNHHVACTGKGCVIRVNSKAGPPGIFEFGPEDWEFLPGLDLAAIPMPWRPDLHEINHIPESLFVTNESAKKLDIFAGEDVFMLGMFVDSHGGPINRPAARFGNISLMPSRLRNKEGYEGDYYCLDMRSRTGFSGSPVFMYRTPGSDLLTSP